MRACPRLRHGAEHGARSGGHLVGVGRCLVTSGGQESRARPVISQGVRALGGNSSANEEAGHGEARAHQEDGAGALVVIMA